MSEPRKPCSGFTLDRLGMQVPCRQYGRYDTDRNGVEHAEARFCHSHSMIGKIQRHNRRLKIDAAWEAQTAELEARRRREIRGLELLANIPDDLLYSPKMERVMSMALKMAEKVEL